MAEESRVPLTSDVTRRTSNNSGGDGPGPGFAFPDASGLSANADELSSRHQQLCAIASTIELLVSEAKASSNIEEDLLVLHHQFKKFEFCIEDADLVGLTVDKADKVIWTRLLRGHRTALRELRNEFEWQRSHLAPAVRVQQLAQLRAQGLGNPFIGETSGEGFEGAATTPPQSPFIIPPMNAAQARVPDLIATPRKPSPMLTKAAGGGQSLSNQESARALLSPMRSAVLTEPRRAPGLMVRERTNRFSLEPDAVEIGGGVEEGKSAPPVAIAAAATPTVNRRGEGQTTLATEPGMPQSDPKGWRAKFDAITPRQWRWITIGSLAVLAIILLAWGGSQIHLGSSDSNPVRAVNPQLPPFVHNSTALASTGGANNSSGDNTTEFSSSTASATLTPPFSTCDVSAIELVDKESGEIFPIWNDSPPAYSTLAPFSQAQISNLQLVVLFKSDSTFAPLSHVGYFLSDSSTVRHELESADDGASFIGDLVELPSGDATISIDTDCVAEWQVVITVLPAESSSSSTAASAESSSSSTSEAHLSSTAAVAISTGATVVDPTAGSSGPSNGVSNGDSSTADVIPVDPVTSSSGGDDVEITSFVGSSTGGGGVEVTSFVGSTAAVDTTSLASSTVSATPIAISSTASALIVSSTADSLSVVSSTSDVGDATMASSTATEDSDVSSSADSIVAISSSSNSLPLEPSTAAADAQASTAFADVLSSTTDVVVVAPSSTAGDVPSDLSSSAEGEAQSPAQSTADPPVQP